MALLRRPITDTSERILRAIDEMAIDAEGRAAAFEAAYGREAAREQLGWVAGVRSAHRVMTEFITEVEHAAARNAAAVIAEYDRRWDVELASQRKRPAVRA